MCFVCYYEFGDKPSKSLAYQIWQSSSLHITQINTDTGITINTQSINNQFRDFYASLYSSESPDNQTQAEQFFGSSDIPSIDSDVASSMEAPFTINELRSALMSMQNRKCPGPDGFPAEFFLKHLQIHCPHCYLTCLMNRCKMAHFLSHCVRLLFL